MKSEVIKGISINESQLTPHLRNRFVGSTEYPSQSENSISATAKTGIAGETFSKGALIYQAADTMWYKAGRTTHAAENVSLVTVAAQGDVFQMDNDTDIEISTPVTAYGNILHLDTAGAFKVAAQPSSGDIYQKVGWALGNNLVHIKITSASLVV